MNDFSSDEFIQIMDDVAVYIAARGRPGLLREHYRWTKDYLAEYYEVTEEFNAVVTFKVPLPQAEVEVSGYATRSHDDAILNLKIAVRPFARTPILRKFHASMDVYDKFLTGRSRVTGALLLLRGFRFALLVVPGLIRSAAIAVGKAVARARSRSLPSVPALLATIVIVFFSADAWRILGTEYDGTYWGLVLLFVATSCGILVSRARGSVLFERLLEQAGVPDLAGDPRPQKVEPRPLGDVNPAAKLVAAGCRPSAGVSEVEDKSSMKAMFGLLAFGQIVVAGVLLAAGLILVGILRVNPQQTADLTTGKMAHVLYHFPWGGMVLTRELLLVSSSLGALPRFGIPLSVCQTRKPVTTLREVFFRALRNR